MSTRDQGQCLTFAKGHADLYCQTSIAPKLLGPTEAKFHVELLWVGITKIDYGAILQAEVFIYICIMNYIGIRPGSRAP